MLGDLDLAERLTGLVPASPDTEGLATEVSRWRDWEGDRTLVALVFDRMRTVELALNRSRQTDVFGVLDDITLPAGAPPSLRARFHGSRALVSYVEGKQEVALQEGLSGVAAAVEARWWARAWLFAQPSGLLALERAEGGPGAAVRIWTLALKAAESRKRDADVAWARGHLGGSLLLAGDDHAGMEHVRGAVAWFGQNPGSGLDAAMFARLLAEAQSEGPDRAARLRRALEVAGPVPPAAPEPRGR